ncbi:MAG: nicotinate-nucleotide--dimethylbenzimidazole phosphoribosyltransferase [Chloroflexota bacterium]
MDNIDTLVQQIKPLDQDVMAAAQARQNILTKPAGSLGRLEQLAIQLAGITGEAQPSIPHKVIVTMAGDHGVAAEGVSAYPQEVTPQMVLNFLGGGAAINVLAGHVGARVVIVDMGVASELLPHPNLVNKKIGLGTQNIAQGPAMSRDEAVAAILAGASVIEAEMEQGLSIVGTGDMGIANTTPSAAIACALTGHTPAKIVGRGTGVDDAGYQRKVAVVQQALDINQPDATDGLDVLAKVGGFEIGGLAGAILATAAHGRPVVVDGFISTAAAMLAVSMAPQVRPYLIAAHRSQEQGHHLMLQWLDKEPLLDIGLRLGEGTGVALAISLVDGACKIMHEMATFGEAGVAEKVEPGKAE